LGLENKPSMKNKILAATALLFIFISVSAQHGTGNGSLELTIGASIPIFKYASGETKVHSEGYAKIGEAINLSYFHPTKNKVGLLVMFLGQRNPLNTTALENKYSNSSYHSWITFFSTGTYPFPNPPPPVPEVYYKNWEFNKDAWYSASLLVGAYTGLPISKEGRLSMTLKAGIGAAYVSSPEYRGITRTDTSVVSILQENNHAFGFAYSVSPGLLYAIKPGTSITFHLNYFGTAAMNFNKMKTSGRMDTDGGVTGTISTWMYTSDVEQSVQTINLAIGIRFNL